MPSWLGSFGTFSFLLKFSHLRIAQGCIKLFKGSTFPSLAGEEGAVAPWVRHSFVEAHLYMFEQKSLFSLALNSFVETLFLPPYLIPGQKSTESNE